ncbi:MAG: hypothetical protein ACOZF0_10245 [Thermodesulfobacteriota bacterium]
MINGIQEKKHGGAAFGPTGQQRPSSMDAGIWGWGQPAEELREKVTAMEMFVSEVPPHYPPARKMKMEGGRTPKPSAKNRMDRVPFHVFPF